MQYSQRYVPAKEVMFHQSIGFNNLSIKTLIKMTDPVVHIRAIEPKDFPSIFELLKQLWPTNQLDSNLINGILIKNYKSDYKKLICAELGDYIIGFCSLTIKDNLWQQGLLGNVDELVIDYKYRGRGFGHQMMAFITKIAINEGCVQLELDSSFHREHAHKFYKDLGFVPRAYLFTKTLK